MSSHYWYAEIAVYSILILCAIIVMSAQVKADEVEKYEQKAVLNGI